MAVAVVGNGGGTPSAPEPGPAASSVTTEDTATEQDSPTPEESSDPAVAGAGADRAAVPVYYVGDTGQGPRLYREFHPGIGGAQLDQALVDAVGRTPDDPDYRTVWPAGTEVVGLVRRDRRRRPDRDRRDQPHRHVPARPARPG